ncbi:MAG: translation initiation factor IF-6 [Candidatus Bathyarchaeota archaeon]|nr:translation initiation factor IF-6 [Candidatus Bathyarchaeota archaeon A05DMB-5]MDH7557536.1 translation initiation factor IF-6 [Candidatus Bathyarchaeota archaeon]
MAIYLSTIVGSVSIGVYSLATDKIVIVPRIVPSKKAERLHEWLKVKLVHTTIGGSILVGALACANSNGILLPHFIKEEELNAIKSTFEGNITIMETKKTAYGNLVLTNDHGAIVDPRLKTPEIQKISETLCVEVVAGEIAGLPYVGSLGVATNKGVLVHPMLKDSERKLLEEVLKVPVEVGTINCGIPYVGTGLIGNSYAAVAGAMTTGPEMFIIGNALDVVKEETA